MKRLLTVVILALLACALPALYADHAVDSGGSTLDDVSWLAGGWRGEHNGTVWEEHWMAPAGGCMTGMFRMHSGDKTMVQEMLIFEESEDGVRFYLRHFGAEGRVWEAEREGPLTFEVVHADEQEIAIRIISDDPELGPKWIVYRSKGEAKAEAWVGSDRTGEGDGFALPLDRL